MSESIKPIAGDEFLSIFRCEYETERFSLIDYTIVNIRPEYKNPKGNISTINLSYREMKKLKKMLNEIELED